MMTMVHFSKYEMRVRFRLPAIRLTFSYAKLQYIVLSPGPVYHTYIHACTYIYICTSIHVYIYMYVPGTIHIHEQRCMISTGTL